jgi:hypothetical protein
MGISDARHKRSPIPITQFPDTTFAREYANAYAKQRGFMARGMKNQFFGDPNWWMKQEKEWDEIIQNQSDPTVRPGLSRPSQQFWGR